MDTVDDWQQMSAKLEWAERNIQELNQTWDDFRTKHYRVEHTDEPTGDRIYRLADAWQIPVMFSLRVGDIVHSLRCALDHFAYRIRSLDCGVTEEDLRRTHFPIGENLEKYQQARGRVARMNPLALAAIDDLQPYGGGSGEVFWHLHALDNVDKHRLLLTVASTNRFQSMAASEVISLKKQFLGMDLDSLTPEQDARLFQTTPKDIHFPLKRGTILAIVPHEEVCATMHFSFELVFGKSEVVAGKSVSTVLYQMAGTVRSILFGFNNRGFFG